jgi:hypothetical protein
MKLFDSTPTKKVVGFFKWFYIVLGIIMFLSFLYGWTLSGFIIGIVFIFFFFIIQKKWEVGRLIISVGGFILSLIFLITFFSSVNKETAGTLTVLGIFFLISILQGFLFASGGARDFFVPLQSAAPVINIQPDNTSPISHPLENWLLYGGFLLAMIAGMVGIVGSTISSRIFSSSLKSAKALPPGGIPLRPFFPQLTPYIGLVVSVIGVALLLSLWGFYFLLKRNNKSIWWLLVIAPLLVLVNAIASFTVFYVLFIAYLLFGIIALVFTIAGKG